MPFTNDTKPSGDLTNDRTSLFARWDDSTVTWDSAFYPWDSGVFSLSQDTKPAGSFTNDVKPA